MTVDYSLSIDQSRFYQEECRKKQFILHYTGTSTAAEVVDIWKASKHRIGSPYIIDRDGSILEIFPHEYWAYHLGWHDEEAEKTSVGIELVNVGCLILKNQKLYYTDRQQRQIFYCDLDERAKYDSCPETWRGRTFFSSFTPQQYSSLNGLMSMLRGKHDVPDVILPQHKRLEMLSPNELKKFRGILTHCNYSSVLDLSPSFDWKWLSASQDS